MRYNTVLLWFLLLLTFIIIAKTIGEWLQRTQTATEGFQGAIANVLSDMTTQALDSAPSTSEVRTHYKNLLVFADADIRKNGVQGLRILGDFRDRVYGPRNFRESLTVDDFLANWPTWIPALDTTIKEPVPDVTTAVASESKLLAYLQKNWPAEKNVDEQTGSIVRGLIEDFGYRFVFDRETETVALRPDFLRKPLLNNWVNPAQAPAKPRKMNP